MKYILILMLSFSTLYGVEVKKHSDKHPAAPTIPFPESPPLKVEVITNQGREAVKFKFDDHSYLLFHNPFSPMGNDSYMHDPECEKCEKYKLIEWERNHPKKK